MPRRGYAGPRAYDQMRSPNQTPLYITRKILSGGQNSRLDPGAITEDSLTIAYNVDLGIPGNLNKRPGLTLIANDVGTRTDALIGYYPTGGTARIYRAEGGNIRKWEGSGNWSSSLGSVTSGDSTLLRGGESGENEVVFFQDGTINPQRIQSGDTFQDLGSGATSPPKSLINLFFRNRLWVLKSGFLYYSDAFSADYSGAFNAANGFRFSGYGDDKGLSAIKDQGLFVFMQNGIWYLNPSVTPVATDKPELLTDTHGAIERKCITQIGDDILYLAPDGIRSIRRTVQDKAQFGTSYPLTYYLKDEIDNIDWSKSSKFHSIFWEDKYFFFFVRSGGSDINRAIVYWPSLDPEKIGKAMAVITGWTVTSTTKFFLSGKENLYGGSTDGKVYKLWTTEADNGTAISEQIETREEDFGYASQTKYGGELELVAAAVGDYDITVYASIDGDSYTLLGTMNLATNGPNLPINLPFSLASTARKSVKFHLDPLGIFRRIKFKFTQDTTTGSDKITLLEYNVTTFLNEYLSED